MVRGERGDRPKGRPGWRTLEKQTPTPGADNGRGATPKPTVARKDSGSPGLIRGLTPLPNVVSPRIDNVRP